MNEDFDVFDFDISKASRTGVVMPFRHAKTGEVLTHKTKEDKAPRELHLVLLGPESGEFQRVFAQIQHRQKKRGDNHSPSDSQVEEDRVSDSKAIARLVVGGLMFTKGKWVEITADNAGDFLYGIGPLRDQAVKFVTDSGNFIAKAA